MHNCCKRVRTWRLNADNPLLQFNNGASNVAGTKKKERRIHVAALLASILEAYEQCIVHYDEILTNQSFPEYYANTIVQKSNGRKHGVEQIQYTIASIVHATTNPRIRCFANICGITEAFNPKEKSILFLRTIEQIYRLKATDKAAPAFEDISSVASVVFMNIALNQSMARRIVKDLFHDPDPYWVFQYLQTPCQELHVNRSWPSGAEADLLEQVGRLSSTTRNANGVRKVDGDSFLELILLTWNTRAQDLYNQLDKACDAEEANQVRSLVDTIALCRRAQNIAPATEEEEKVFAELLAKYWLADIPWDDPELYASYFSDWTRPHRDIKKLFTKYRENEINRQDINHPWNWEDWHWEMDWDWGGLLLERSVKDEASFYRLPNDSGVLNIGHCMMGDRNMQKMGQFLQKPYRQLHKLVIRGNAMVEQGCENIVRAIKSTQSNIQELDLSDNMIGRDGAKALEKILTMDNCLINTLRLDNNQLGDVVGKPFLLRIASSNRSLRVLSLGHNKLSCGNIIAKLLQQHGSLKQLNISWNEIRGHEAIAIAGAIADNTLLEQLDFSYNGAGDLGFQAFLRALHTNSSFRKLSLSHNNINKIPSSKPLLKALSSSIESFDLSGNLLGDTIVHELLASEHASKVILHNCMLSSTTQ
ncbi:hypothetical protein THRCLA_07872 [Thraustotheca clavata]|uniref:Uncharacterized protein n=1 Tax=Thraustotheca clavata TaxID=74557 RepID=A0A1V9ZBQ8_9STRA|nr:hypothetical protein THRCLA_07872 [Thraustotheca clavata]